MKFEDPIHSVAGALGMVLAYAAAGILAMLAHSIKAYFKRKTAFKVMTDSLSSSLQMQTYLAEERVKYDADRIALCQFHNGEHFVSGASVQKVTLTNYVLRPGIGIPMSGAGQPMVSIPASYMTSLLNEIFEKGYSVTRHGEIPPDHWFHRYLTMNGIDTVVTCLVPGNTQRSAYGILAFSWMDEHEISDVCIKQVMDTARKASAFM